MWHAYIAKFTFEIQAFSLEKKRKEIYSLL